MYVRLDAGKTYQPEFQITFDRKTDRKEYRQFLKTSREESLRQEKEWEKTIKAYRAPTGSEGVRLYVLPSTGA